MLFFVSMTFQGCFEIIEQIQFKKDGSGNFQLTLNLSKSKTKLNSMMKLETVNGHPVPTKESISAKVKEIEQVVAKTPGITNVRTSLDFNNFIGVLSCNFSSVVQLNKAIKYVKVKEKATGAALEDHYGYDSQTKVFSRINKYPMKKGYSSMTKADKEIFSNASYTAIYKFESDITGYSNKDAKISPNKRAIMLNSRALDIITEKKSIENNINLTNQ